MKKALSLLLSAALLCGTFGLSAGAAAGEPAVIRQVAAVLGVNAEQSGTVTRGAFARMLAGASAYKNQIAAVVSPYRDVPHSDPAAGAIKLAADKGWMSGYLDGSFRPRQAVTAAEAMTAVLGVLGYTPADFAGSYPQAQMALAATLGLRDGISAESTSSISNSDCARLLYNLLSAKPKEGEQKYAQTLGYALDSAGNPDYTAMLQKATEGPVVVTAAGWKSALSFTPQRVFRNDAPATANDLQPWDVLYYDRVGQTVWAYARRVSGTLEKTAPNKQSPTSVTVAGTEYPVLGAAVAALGSSGGLPLGSNVTLLLGRNGEAVAAYAASALTSELVGVVISSETKNFPSATGTNFDAPSVTIIGLDGQNYTLRADRKYETGALVRVTFATDKTNITSLGSSASISGRVSAAAGRIGNTPVSPTANILDADETGGARVFLSRLDGLNLSSDNVRWAETNPAGEITGLILKDLTGDRHAYGIVLSAKEQSENMSTSGTYRFLINGEQSDLSTSDKLFGIQPGPAKFVRKSGEISSIRPPSELKQVELLSGMTVRGGGKAYTISDRCAAYVVVNGMYRRIDRNELDTGRYRIRAFYDREDALGGRVRVLLASPRT